MPDTYRSVFRAGLFSGQVAIVTGGGSGAARAGMLNFTETAAFEWAPVRVNAVAPGWIASSGLDHYPREMTEHIRSLPNAKRPREISHKNKTQPFDGFHIAQTPKVLD